MATQDSKDKKISEVPHLEDVTGVEKIPVSAAGGVPRYVEVKQVVEKAMGSIESISLEYIDSKFVTPPQPPEGVNNDVWLISWEGNLASCAKVVREGFVGFSLTEAKAISENAPSFVRHYDDYKKAQEAISRTLQYRDEHYPDLIINFEIR